MAAGAFSAAASHPGARFPPTAVSGPRHMLDSDRCRIADRVIGVRRYGRRQRTERFRCAWSCATHGARRDKSRPLAFGDASDAIGDVNRRNLAARYETLQCLCGNAE